MSPYSYIPWPDFAAPSPDLGRPSRPAAWFLLSALTLPVLPSCVASDEWVREPEAGLKSSQAETQRPASCTGKAATWFGTDPDWVRVGGSIDPRTPFVEEEGVSGQVLSDVPVTENQNPRVAPNDSPWSHFSKDVNVWLTLDPSYRHLLADGNFREGSLRERGKLEIELERGAVPLFAFPATGDRMTVWGPLIWDCAHGNNTEHWGDAYRTEIHPPVGWVIYRNTADADGAPEGKQRNDPWVWYGPGDRTGIGATFSNPSLHNVPVQATVADVFLSSFGGDAVESLNGYNGGGVVGPEIDDADHWRQDLLRQDYSFFVPASPRPSPNTVMVWEEEDRCSQVPPSPGNPPFDDVEEVGEAGDWGPLLSEKNDYGHDSEAEDIGTPACNIPVEVQEDEAHGGIQVTVRAHSAGVPYPANDYVAFARRYKVAWAYRGLPRSGVPSPARTFRVDFQELQVYDDHEACIEDGEWVMSIRVNEAWIHPVRGRGDGGDPFWETGAIDDGRCFFDPDPYQEYEIGEALTVSVVSGHSLNIWVKSYDLESVPGSWVEDNPVTNVFRTEAQLTDISQTGPKTFVSGIRDEHLQGSHAIVYTITDVTPEAGI